MPPQRVVDLLHDPARNQAHNLCLRFDNRPFSRKVDLFFYLHAVCGTKPLLKHLKAFVASVSGFYLVVLTLSLWMLHIVWLLFLLMIFERGRSTCRVNDETQRAANLWNELVATVKKVDAVKISGVDFENLGSFS